jgi:hypothetical protein
MHGIIDTNKCIRFRPPCSFCIRGTKGGAELGIDIKGPVNMTLKALKISKRSSSTNFDELFTSLYEGETPGDIIMVMALRSISKPMQVRTGPEICFALSWGKLISSHN